MEKPGQPPKEAHTISALLDAPPNASTTDELPFLLGQLLSLRECRTTPRQHADVLTKIQTRTLAAAAVLIPSFTDLSLPIPRKTRQTVRGLQDLLRALAEETLSISTSGAFEHDHQEVVSALLWQGMHALSLHLLISDLAASPASTGVWLHLHNTYEKACDLGFEKTQPKGAASTFRNLYFSSILLGCAQPAAFTSNEINFVASYLTRFSGLANFLADGGHDSQSTFWIDVSRDSPATPCSRKTPPPDTTVRYFTCTRLAALIEKQLAALSSGASPLQLDLSYFAGTPAGRGVLRRLACFLGTPGKRRFPRRRQHHRAVVCSGLENLWNLFSRKEAANIETTSWMITNESPDGYSIMHVLGKTTDVTAGDVIALRTETGNAWQVSIIRWVLSENQEHLELGLQVFATNAIPAMLTQISDSSDRARNQPVLILPRILPLRSNDMLVAPSGVLDEKPQHIILVIEQGNIEIREVRNTNLDEQNGHIEVFSIEAENQCDD